MKKIVLACIAVVVCTMVALGYAVWCMWKAAQVIDEEAVRIDLVQIANENLNGHGKTTKDAEGIENPGESPSEEAR